MNVLHEPTTFLEDFEISSLSLSAPRAAASDAVARTYPLIQC
jgi:hypothetical protein